MPGDELTAIQGGLDDEFLTYGVQYTADPVTDPADAEATDKTTKVWVCGCVCDCVYDCVENTVVQVAPIDVIWYCSKCTAYCKECARPPRQPDAVSLTGRKHGDIYEKDLFASHERSQFHLDSLTHEAGQEKDKADGKIKTQVKLTEVLTPEDELQNNYILGVLWLIVYHVALCLIGPLRDLAQVWGVGMLPLALYCLMSVAVYCILQCSSSSPVQCSSSSPVQCSSSSSV